MKEWRPKGWDASAEATAKQCAGDKDFKKSALEVVIRGMFEAGADAMLIKIREEIEKVENPNNIQRDEFVITWAVNQAFEQCRQKILDLLSISSKE